jgi:aspartate carbamoyltransferase catalytic subunit
MAGEMVTTGIEGLDDIEMINGEPAGKDFLSMRQLSEDDIYYYIDEAYVAEEIIRNPDPRQGGITLFPFKVLEVIMRQDSTRTAGSMATAMGKLGGRVTYFSGMKSSSEGKGEVPNDSSIAFSTQSDLIATRTKEDGGPALAAQVIRESYNNGKLWKRQPVINLGDGTNEHPTQATGDLFTIHKHFGALRDKTMAMVGDHERYRAFHSDMLGAAAVGMNVISVESPAAPVPPYLVDLLGNKLQRTDDLDEAMKHADILMMGRNPGEYTGEEPTEQARSAELAEAYAKWHVNRDRLQQMHPDAIELHPRPRNGELHPDVDADPRAMDVPQMANMMPMRMAIISNCLGVSIREAAEIA